MAVTAALDIGRLRHRVTLQNETATADGDGGFTKTHTALSPETVWASIEVASASLMERTTASTIRAIASHLVEMRYHSGVTTNTRITFGSRYLFVRGVQNVDEAGVVSRLICEEAVA